MPTQVVETEEENLIILDDIVEENISPEIKIEEPILSEEIIDFGNNEENKDSTIDINHDLLNSSDVEEKQTPIVIADNIEEISEINNDSGLDLGDLGSDISFDNTSDILGSTSELGGGNTKDDSSDLNSILDETIVKLQSRGDIISEDKSIEQSNIKDFKSQISDLESNVSTSESIVSELNKESSKIKSNIKSLERMKLKDEIAETKKETSAKIHNSKRTR